MRYQVKIDQQIIDIAKDKVDKYPPELRIEMQKEFWHAINTEEAREERQRKIEEARAEYHTLKDAKEEPVAKPAGQASQARPSFLSRLRTLVKNVFGKAVVAGENDKRANSAPKKAVEQSKNANGQALHQSILEKTKQRQPL